MNDFDASQNNDTNESDKQNILPETFGVVPAKRSGIGIAFVGILIVIILSGAVYAGILAYDRFRKDTAQEISGTPEDVTRVSLTDFDTDNKVKQVLDPFQGQTAGTSRVLGEKADFGDAPEETSVIGQVDYELFGSFPTVLDETLAGSIRHLENDQSFFLGLRKYNDSVSLEYDANTVNLDEHDDGVIFPLLSPCGKTGIQVEVTVPNNLNPPYYLNALADWDMSGRWSGSSACRADDETFEVPEWFIQNMDLSDFFDLRPGQSRRLIIPDFFTGPAGEKAWFRFTLTNEPVSVHGENQDWDGSGYFMRGETEDYLVPFFSEKNSKKIVVAEKKEEEKDEEEDIFEDILPGYKDILTELMFTDVSRDAWYAPYVQYVSGNNLINGFNDKTFRPEGPVTRAEVVTVALRMTGAELQGDPADTDGDGLLDLEEQILQTDAKNPDTDGDGLNDYREIMNFTDPGEAGRTLEKIPLPLDTIRSRHWARGNIAKALLLGFISEKSFSEKNLFHPDQPATNEFALAVLLRASGKALPSEDLLENAEVLGLITDKKTFQTQALVNRAVLAKFVAVLKNN